jgi:hypothetical protein
VRNRERKQSERYRWREITYTGGSHVPLKESKSTGKIKRHKERRKEKKEDQDKQRKKEREKKEWETGNKWSAEWHTAHDNVGRDVFETSTIASKVLCPYLTYTREPPVIICDANVVGDGAAVGAFSGASSLSSSILYPSACRQTTSNSFPSSVGISSPLCSAYSLGSSVGISSAKQCSGLPSLLTFDHLLKQWSSTSLKRSWWNTKHITYWWLTVFISSLMQRSPSKCSLARALGNFDGTTGLLWRFFGRTSQTAPTPWRSFWRGMFFSNVAVFFARCNGHFTKILRSVTHSIAGIW